MAETTASTDLEILAADGTTWVPLMLRTAYDADGNELPKTFQEELSAVTADSPLGEWLEQYVQQYWGQGSGVGYNAAPGCNTRLGVERSPYGPVGQVVPGGAATEVAVTIAGASFSRITAIVEYDGDIYVSQAGDGNATTARVMRSAGGTAALANVLALGVNEYVRDMIVSDDGSGTGHQVLFVSSSDGSGYEAGANGRLHKYDSATGLWTSTAAALFGANGRNALAKVFWQTEDGVGANRLATISGPNTIAYTLPNQDPMLAASWVEGVLVNTATGLLSLAAARHHVWAGANDGLFDLTAFGDTPNLIGYDIPRHDLTGRHIKYFNEYVYMSVANTLHRVYVGTPGALQARPGPCGPGWGTAARNTHQGPVTCIGEDQGCLVVGTYNFATLRGAVWYGIESSDPASKNPLEWHGPEIVANTDLYAQELMVTSTGAGSGMRMWLASTTVTPGVAPWLGYVSVPLAGSSLSDLLSGGGHQFAKGDGVGAWNATCQLRSLPITLGDGVAVKISNEQGIGTEGLEDSLTGTRLATYLRADPDPNSDAWGTGATVISGPVQNNIPATTSGYRLEYRIDFFGSSTATPPVLNAVRYTFFRRAPSFLTYTLDVEYGDGVADREDGHDGAISPTTITTLLQGATGAGRTTMRFPDDSRYTVVLRQSLAGPVTLVPNGAYGKRVASRLTVAILSAAL